MHNQLWNLLEVQLVEQCKTVFPNGHAGIQTWIRHLSGPASIRLLDRGLRRFLRHPYAYASRLCSFPSSPSELPCSPLLFAVLEAFCEPEPQNDLCEEGLEAGEDKTEQEIYMARALAELLHLGSHHTANVIAHALSTFLSQHTTEFVTPHSSCRVAS